MSISDDEHRRFVRGELALMAERMRLIVVCLAVIGFSAVVIAAVAVAR